MADPTLTNIQILRSPVPHKRPEPGLMLDGQLAINYKATDPGLFTKTVEETLVKFGPVSISNDGLWPNHPTIQAVDGFPGNSHGEEWLDGRAAFFSPVEKIWDEEKDQWVTTNGFVVNDLTGDFTLEKALYLTRLYADHVNINGPLEVNGEFIPFGTTCTYDVGSPSNRWKGLYSCFMNTTGDLLVGGDSNLDGYLQVGGYLTVNGNADLQGTVTLGTIPGSGDTLKVGSNATFDGTVTIVGDTSGRALTLSSDLTAKGNVELGGGCGVTTLHVYSKTTFHCGTTFANQSLESDSAVIGDLNVTGETILGSGCATSTIDLKGATTVHCDVLPNADRTINLGSTTRRFANIYTGDLHLKNERGDWTLIEEEDALTIRNNKTGQRFAINMTPYEG